MANQTLRIAEIIKNLNLSNINIPYDSYSYTKIKMNTSSATRTIKYGHLGDGVNFLLLKISYDDQNPYSQIEENQNIEYWFDDQPTIKRKAHKLLIFTGNSAHKVPQIYLRNTSGLKVDIDVLMSNKTQEDIDVSTFPNELISYSNLYYNNILSDTYWNSSKNLSGSSELRIYDTSDNLLVKISYSDISDISVSQNYSKLFIYADDNRKTYSLDFVNRFEMNQAYSRIQWVINNKYERYLSKTNPLLDVDEPVFTVNSGVTPATSNIYVYPVIRDESSGLTTITTNDILNYFISGITDDRDGIIPVTGSTIELKDKNLESITGITELGAYNVFIFIKDNANNLSFNYYVIHVDDEQPTIIFENTATGNTFTMTIPDDTASAGQGVTHSDIINSTVIKVDDVSGSIDPSNINIIISGDTLYQTAKVHGDYTVTYTVSDISGNEISYIKTMTVGGATIVESGATYEVQTGTTSVSLVYNGDEGTTAQVVLTGQTFTIANSGGSFVWDLGGPTQYTFTYTGETHLVTLSGDTYEIEWVGFGSFILGLSATDYRLFTVNMPSTFGIVVSGSTTGTLQNTSSISTAPTYPVLTGETITVYVVDENNPVNYWKSATYNGSGGTADYNNNMYTVTNFEGDKALTLVEGTSTILELLLNDINYDENDFVLSTDNLGIIDSYYSSGGTIRYTVPSYENVTINLLPKNSDHIVDSWTYSGTSTFIYDSGNTNFTCVNFSEPTGITSMYINITVMFNIGFGLQKGYSGEDAFEISLSGDTGYTSNLTLDRTTLSPTIDTTYVYVRFKPSVVKEYNSNIVHNTEYAQIKKLGISGNGV